MRRPSLAMVGTMAAGVAAKPSRIGPREAMAGVMPSVVANHRHSLGRGRPARLRATQAKDDV